MYKKDQGEDMDMLAPCGLDCSTCNIYLAPSRPEIAEKLTQWFLNNGHPDAKADWFHCCGCPGTKEELWSADCEIRACVVEQKGLRYCSECPEFPCQRLENWAQGSPRYRAALERLRGMNAKATS